LNSSDSDESPSFKIRANKKARIPDWAQNEKSIRIELNPQLKDPTVYDKYFGRINPQDYTVVPENVIDDMFYQGIGLEEVKHKRLINITYTS